MIIKAILILSITLALTAIQFTQPVAVKAHPLPVGVLFK